MFERRVDGVWCGDASLERRARPTAARRRGGAWTRRRERVSIRRGLPLGRAAVLGRGAHAWRRCSWAINSAISLSTSSRGLSPGWDLIIAAILLLLRPLSTSDSAQSASAVISMRIMAAIRKQLSAIPRSKTPPILHFERRPGCFAGAVRGRRTHLNLSVSSSTRLQDTRKRQESQVDLPSRGDFLCLAES